MNPLFRPIPPGERRERLRAYDAFIALRDGEPDFERRTLTLREPIMRRFESSSIRYPGPVDETLFRRQLARFDPRLPTPPELLLLLAYVKMNAGEAYGVETTVAARHAPGADVPYPERLVALEEIYHTRLLLSATDVFGLKVDAVYLAPLALRLLIGALSRLPQRAFRSLLLAAEIVGLQAFWRLFQATGRILRECGEVRDTLQERVSEILVDEIGHVSFNRLRLGRAGMAVARAFVPLLAKLTGLFTPETVPIGVAGISIRDALRFDLDQLPDEIRRRAFVA
jgi:hypothetical protein